MGEKETEVSVADKDGKRGSYLTFALEDDVYGVPAGEVAEIVGPGPITFVPHVPAYVKGIVGLRGKAIPVIDLKWLLLRRKTSYGEGARLIVINDAKAGNGMAGFLVDEVEEVLQIDDDAVTLPPADGSGGGAAFVRGIGSREGRAVRILDCGRILSAGDGDKF